MDDWFPGRIPETTGVFCTEADSWTGFKLLVKIVGMLIQPQECYYIHYYTPNTLFK
jgi:hypothetical protein